MTKKTITKTIQFFCVEWNGTHTLGRKTPIKLPTERTESDETDLAES